MKKSIFTVALFASALVHAGGFAVPESQKDPYQEILAKWNKPLGKTYYAMFPRESCTKDEKITSTPSYIDKQLYQATEPVKLIPKRVLNEKFSRNPFDIFYEVEIDGKDKGYIRLMSILNLGAPYPYTEKQLGEDCFFDIPPDEVQKNLASLVAEREAETKKTQAEAPATIRTFPQPLFCEQYGKAIRGEELQYFGNLPNAAKIFKAEAARRKLSFNDELTKSERLKSRVTECQLYASWGRPNDQNKTVGRWGVHIQHVYGRTYIYTENGIVTSWQD